MCLLLCTISVELWLLNVFQSLRSQDGHPGRFMSDLIRPVSTVYPLKMSCKGKVVHGLGAQNRSVLCSHSIPFKAPKPVSGSMLLFRKFKASLGISERRNYSSSFEDEDKLGTICWCNWHSSFYNFKQNL